MVKALLYSSSAAKRGIFLILCVMLMFVLALQAPPSARASGCGANVFTYTATTSNTSGHITAINSSITNNHPDIRFEVSQLYTGAYDPHPSGVWYNSFAGRWAILNEDTQPMPIGPAFSIREQPDPVLCCQNGRSTATRPPQATSWGTTPSLITQSPITILTPP
jgi:hypothetical protein